MSLTIYKISSYVNRRVSGGTFFGGGASNGGFIDLSNYYTKSELQTSGLSIVNFDNITEAYHNNLLGLEGGNIADNSSGESSGEAGEYYHLSLYDYSRLTMLNFSMSLVEDISNVVTLVNDESSPGGSMYYGTDAGGTKGWFGLPAGALDSTGTYGGENLWEADSLGVLSPIVDEGVRVGGVFIDDIYIQGLDGGANGGNLAIRAGDGTNGGNISFNAGRGDIPAQDGHLDIKGQFIRLEPDTDGYVYLYSTSNIATKVYLQAYGNNDNGIDLILQGGAGTIVPSDGGAVRILGGDKYTTGIIGKIYIGTGSAGTNPLSEAGVDDTCFLTYNPTTGQISWMTI